MSGALALRESLPPNAAAMASCAHCGERLPTGAGRFCCNGCAAAYRLIQDMGLGRYYGGRSLDTGTRLPRPPDEPAADPAACAIADADGTATLHLLVDGLHCAACVWLIETALRRQPDVVEARVNLTSRRLRLRWRGDAGSGARLVDMVQRLGYRAVPYDAPRVAAATALEERQLLRALAVAGFAAGNVMLLSVSVWAGLAGEMGQATRDLLHWVSALIALPAAAYAGQPFFRSAWGALRRGRTNMDVPISIGVTLATAMSLYETIQSGRHAYFDSAVMLLFFLLVGRYLDRRARGRARSAAEQLVALTAQAVTVAARDGQMKRLPATAIALGDTVLVAAGERVAVDGCILDGRTSLDKSLIDGESLPAEAGPGSTVLAGMLNLTAPLRVTVTATGERTFLAEIVRLMETAEQGRARLVLLADRVARRYAPAVHVLALGTFFAWIFVVPWQDAML
ncbi:MAG TPA: heavy metal translocating P-type ATPase metal-binding domain-containing protein, partial [Stellaceae bacterium]